MPCRHYERRGGRKPPEKMYIYVVRLYLRLSRQAAALLGFQACCSILEHVHRAPKAKARRTHAC